MKQCLDVFYLNRRNTTILEEKLYTVSWFPSWTVSLFQRWFSKTRWPFCQFLSRGCWLHANSGSNLLWVEDIVIGFLRKASLQKATLLQHFGHEKGEIGISFLFLHSLCMEVLCALWVLSVATLLARCIHLLSSRQMHILVDGSQHNMHDEVRIPKKKHQLKDTPLSAVITN